MRCELQLLNLKMPNLFYIAKGYINDKGVSTSAIIRKLGTLQELIKEHGPTRDNVMA